MFSDVIPVMTIIPKTPRDNAVEWFVRLQDPEVEEAAWGAFTAWLEESPANAKAYAAVEATWVDLDLAHEIMAEGTPPPSGRAAPRVARGRRRRFAAGLAAVLAAAAASAAALLLTPSTQTYSTGPQEHLSVRLGDGSHIYLNQATALRVSYSPLARRVTLDEGEAAFDVQHNAMKPFVVSAGDRSVRVLGTEFDVLRHAGRLQVTVKRGIVAVGPLHRAAEARLTAGERLDRQAGQASARISRVDPDDAAAWRRGLLVYRDRPLSEVAEDLTRYLQKPVLIDASASRLRFTGALRIGAEQAMLRDLEGFLPLTADVTPTATRLKARAAR